MPRKTSDASSFDSHSTFLNPYENPMSATVNLTSAAVSGNDRFLPFQVKTSSESGLMEPNSRPIRELLSISIWTGLKGRLALSLTR
ncbi:hypothetical protein OGATHE_004836 [Ogataea polymorpha]|uniref:Uncharacterized protein n=1 Tax=Ogataea polymorpha TaxID=460523 RepID=A0A9P8T2S8_9ASCO|nr:hypothetical protein OGATHE_004836 [Ogataea polymorpha]